MDVFMDRPFYTTIANFDVADVYMPNQEKGDEIENAPERIVHSKHERFSYPSRTNETRSDSIFDVVQYKPTSDSLEQISEHQAVKYKDKAIAMKNKRKEVAFHGKFNEDWPGFIKMLEESESVWDRHLGRISVPNHRIDLLNADVKPVRSYPYRARPSARKVVGTEIGRIITWEAIEPESIEWTDPIVFARNKDGSLHFASPTRNQIPPPSVFRTLSLPWTNVCTA